MGQVFTRMTWQELLNALNEERGKTSALVKQLNEAGEENERLRSELTEARERLDRRDEQLNRRGEDLNVHINSNCDLIDQLDASNARIATLEDRCQWLLDSILDKAPTGNITCEII